MATPETANDPGVASGMAKVLVAWLGAAWGSLTMQDVVLALTAVYTLLQVYVLVRDRILRRGPPAH